MKDEVTRPFESIESAQDFVSLLCDSVEEAVRDVRGDLETAMADGQHRRAHALHLAIYKMGQLSSHMQKSRRILNDLRTLRRLLASELN